MVALAGLTATTVTAATAGPSAAGLSAAAASGSARAAARVTLVTGDTVSMDGTGRVTDVRRGKGRGHIGFSVRRFAGHAYVVPQDATRLLGSGRLDRRLFDITQLVKDGYDDAHRKRLPLIVSYRGGSGTRAGTRRALAAADAEVERQLPAIRGEALSADKPDAGDVWRALTDPVADRTAVTTAPGIDRVWLDGRVKAAPQDDSSDPDPEGGVAQIGAPEAWKKGYDGKGVKIAVLDTGVDATHPDLKGSILKAKDFSDSGSTTDGQGHGTHVASTVVGSGAKSHGKYKGVAPGAKLLVGKVLDDTGVGSDSSIIAGMQWAVAQGAKVVSMSLGSTDTPGVDPMEKAVNGLSASSHALFVIAAGNEGPSDTTLGTPGSAAAALTVAAVDRHDKIADFSSRGPTADGRLKPDIAAPGVDIVAAQAAHTSEGEEVAPGYVSMSGTSMATPHIAGAAAILAQEHPDWTGERIKAALTASVKPLTGTTAYEAGAGRVDLTRATGADVTTEPSSVDFGTASWPHHDDRPVTRTLSYRNPGAKPLTLDLTADATGPDGGNAPTGMFTVSPARLTVPAGGTAQATVTADIRLGGADGAYSGAVTATGGGQSVRTALGVIREVESYKLTLTVTRRDGKRDDGPGVTVAGLDTGKQYTPFDDGKSHPDGTVTLRLPKGRYLIDVQSVDPRGRTALMVAPHFVLGHDTALAFDGRKAKPVKVTAPDRRATLRDAQVLFAAHGAKPAYDYAGGNTVDADTTLGQVGPGTPADSFVTQLGGIWQRTATSPTYNLVTTRTGSFFTGLNRTFSSTRGMARVNTSVATALPQAGTAPQVSWSTPDWPQLGRASLFSEGALRPAPTASLVQYLSTDRGLRWNLGSRIANGSHNEDSVSFLTARRFEPGRTYRVALNGGVHGPAVAPASGTGAKRLGGYYYVCVPMFSDGPGNLAYLPQAAITTRLSSGSRVFTSTTDDTCLNVYGGLPAAPTRYRLSISTDRAKDYRTSDHVDAVWTFTSRDNGETKGAPFPLSVVRFHPQLSLTDTAKAGARVTVPLSLQGPAAAKGHLKSLTVRVSYDGGRTWKPVTVHTNASGKRYLTLTHPKKPGTVSFRAALADTDGNTATETVHTAYRTVR
ncbi:S8 family serine peptidase [Streptomyces sp. T12]|uniref:S8 family serine peptidase n=1 Tax=Streptomyces sp. T12 TaxID=477697 RepID=UPI002366C43E|nr:S8 family serine peptidase [Streptomyces sp. T12]WDF43305.1 S8 family serine peptidase [Streptomyces sp. T12]